MSQDQPVRQNIAERVKARYASDLRGLDDAAATLIHELEIVRAEIAEAESKKGGQALVENENRISNAYRALMKKIGTIQSLQQSGLYNVRSRSNGG